jgi:parallel beta-helix repeat protein
MNIRWRVPSLIAAALVAAAGMVLLLIVLAGPARAAPGTLCVAPGGVGCGGPCEGTCYASVQTAVNDADPADEILVAAGVYTRNVASWVVVINESIAVRGGYTTTNWTASYPVTQVTTLDGEGQVGVVYISGDITPTLEGLWLTNGHASDGGGLYALDAHPTISGCHVFSNAATFNGGGIRLRDSPTATLANNWIYSNTADNGGGLYFGRSASGGGCTGATVVGNEIYSNTATYDGGGLTLGSSSFASVLRDNDIFCNRAYDDGGGINVMSSDGVMLIDNRFHSNMADGIGGGISIGNSDDVTLMGNEIYSNTAASLGGGGIVLWGSQDARLINTLVVDNWAVGNNGGGIYVGNSDAHLLHTTLARNGGWNGMCVAGTTTVYMTNTILVSHTVGVKLDSSLGSVSLEATLWGAGEWANDVDVQAATGSIATGTVNVQGDPAFVDPDGGDYHIAMGSAAVDAGVDVGVETDIDGDPRPIGRPDLGVDEWGMKTYLPLVLR